ncbi:MAG TPA: GIY-YIG nuclease family protein [Chloroflexia bacterium]|nr:GIY-YIG nuclease family protein [Chloroflexia bacterium]
MSDQETQAQVEVREAFVYMLECADGTLYTGWTYQLEERLKRHNSGKGARYTRARLPVKMVYSERLPGERAARQREYALKQLPRSAKLLLISQYKGQP